MITSGYIKEQWVLQEVLNVFLVRFLWGRCRGCCLECLERSGLPHQPTQSALVLLRLQVDLHLRTPRDVPVAVFTLEKLPNKINIYNFQPSVDVNNYLTRGHPARFACQPCLNSRSRSTTTIYGTYSVHKTAVLGLRLVFT